MIEKLEEIRRHYASVTERLSGADAAANQEEYRALSKERSGLEEIVGGYEKYLLNEAAIAECKLLQEDKADPEMAALAAEELAELEEERLRLTEELKLLLLPKDPNDEKNVIIELRAGTGGEEAALFGADLLRMYLRYAERNRLKVEFLDENMTDRGGVKEVVLSMSGRSVYSKLKFESGVHRVQRVPDTESQGRIHTSAATVAVLPEAEDIDVEINPSELRIDIFRSSGAGGQHVNKTESAIRITHLPTGIVVTCQDERSQHKNKDKAMRVLKSRLYDLRQTEQAQKLSLDRKSQVGSGDRSERIRTYNFPQNRVTDHRIGLTMHKLDQFMDGDMNEMLDALALADRAAKLSE